MEGSVNKRFFVLILLIVSCVQQASGIVVSLEGNFGSGKSTLIKILAAALDTPFMAEEWQQWHNKNLFYSFVQDRSRWAYTMGQSIIMARLFALHDLKNNHRNASSLLLERCVFSQLNVFSRMLHEQGYMNDFEWDLLVNQTGLAVQMANYAVDGYIYIKTDLDTCCNRVKLRRKPKDKFLSRDFLALIEDVYERWLTQGRFINGMGVAPILVIDGTQDFKDDSRVQEQIVLQIRTFIQSLAVRA